MTTARAAPGSQTNVADLAGLAESAVSWVTVSNMPLAQIEAYKARVGWTVPFVSSHGSSLSDDCGAGGGFVLSVFLRDGADVYRWSGKAQPCAWGGMARLTLGQSFDESAKPGAPAQPRPPPPAGPALGSKPRRTARSCATARG
jgi:hypothetical protein